MATSSHEQRRLHQRQQPDAQHDAAERAPVDLEALEKGQDLSPEMAGVLQPQLGNVALQDLLGQSASDRASNAASADLEEEQGEELVESEELVEDLELEGVSFGGGGGGGGAGGGGAGDPWDVGLLFGGDPDDDTPNRPRKRAAAPKRLPDDADEDDDLFDEPEDEAGDPDALDRASMAPVERRLGPAAPAGELVADDRYQAPVGALGEALYLGRRRLSPEALIAVDGPADPLGRPIGIGRFLAESAESPRARAIARLVCRGAASLCPEVGGYAGAAARLAALAACAEAAEGGGAATDRAVKLSLTDSAWTAAVEAAQPAQRRGRLRGAVVVQVALGRDALSDAGARLVGPSPLGRQAIRRLLPPPLLSDIPSLDFAALAPPPAPADDDLAALDAVLLELTGGAPPSPFPTLQRATIQPLLTATRALMMAMGRSYVEVAAGAIAVRRVRPGAAVSSTVRQADRAITALAKTTLAAGRTLERAVDYQLRHLDADELEGAARDLRHALVALEGLKDWTFDTLAGALDA